MNTSISAFYHAFRGDMLYEKDKSRAAHHYMLASKKEHPRAQFRLGDMLKNGEGVEKDKRGAVRWFRRSAEHGDALALVNLGYCYQFGEGVTQNLVIACTLYSISKNRGDKLATKFFERIQKHISDNQLLEAKRLSSEWKVGTPLPTASYYEGMQAFDAGHYLKAIENCGPFAERGDSVAQMILGCIYEHGLGTSKNYLKAIEWYTYAADQGVTLAQLTLGNIYYHGYDAPQNFIKAAHFYHLAAEQGDTNAQTRLGLMYENGYGVNQSFELAIQWYTRAAEEGNSEAQFNLGNMYTEGRGVIENPVLAYLLCNLSAAQGYEPALTSRNQFLEKLSNEQINEAQKLGSEWKCGHPLPTSKHVLTYPVKPEFKNMIFVFITSTNTSASGLCSY